ncbi:hypothetical protein K450DRAFT_268941 [Umbelopsis ramanniana AG]|uniref:Uncharacterized protein n=1 Tax=Umbelopsis ramanniana AG TaxID=1314678 RepID=A0AAD5HG21_UMBRA|nr:uncharacterized protein K450DRAFT_268941 [Umbelopsis ramanniana AG]KAI8583020.1 hypothetical protein K450DRAFT_268941 [Umbelopsis ramanniana AG]
MKIYTSLLLATTALVGTSYGCANQAVYDLCLKTGQAALGACGPAASNAKCACAAQKQILACYSECPDDASVFDLGTIQAGQVQVFCSIPGAEPQVSNVMATNTMNPASNMASPIQASATASPSASVPPSNSINDMTVGKKDTPANEQSTQKSGASRWVAGNYSTMAALGMVCMYMAM